jgi:hypothetical protein
MGSGDLVSTSDGLAQEGTVKGPSLRDLFLEQQTVLETTLRRNRKVIKHPGTLGDASELDWIGMLREYLPARYQVDKAIVLDADGNFSDAIDVVVYDRQYCPLLFRHNNALYLPAESVYAVFEVKQSLNKEMVAYASDKAASVRRLRRTSVPIQHAGGTHAPKEPFGILGGILCLESDWQPALGVPLDAALCEPGPDGHLDFGCVLCHGSFEVVYPQEGVPQIDKSERETALIFFCLRLLQRLQQLGTVTALDVREYGKGF